jgi:hypothetical protein
MIVIQDTILSEELFDKKFTCNLEKCKGACCVEGDRGAPLNKDELEIIANLLPKIKPYMNPDFAKDVDKKGFYEIDVDGEPVTTCQPSGECNFVVYDKEGITQCAIELANNDKVIDYKKPISCHLYPIRLQKYKAFTAVNYSQWDICKPACTLGEELSMPVYKFTKDALIRKFGQEWYNEVEATAQHLNTSK